MPSPFLLDRPKSKFIEIQTGCVPCDTMHTAYQYSIKYDSTTRKIFFPSYNNAYVLYRNINLGPYSLRVMPAKVGGIDFDANCVYGVSWDVGYAYKWTPRGIEDSTGFVDAVSPVAYQGVVSVDATLTNYLVTGCNHYESSAGDGLFLINKSDLSTAYTYRSTGTGDGQFNEVRGIEVVGSYVYVSDHSNNRVAKVAIDTGTPALTWSTSYTNSYTTAVNDITTDGTYWYVATDSAINKLSSDFATRVATAAYGASAICLMPNVGDSADGTNSTVVAYDQTTRTLYRFKSSDLTPITSYVGSSSAADTFDPIITGTSGTWKMSDGAQLATSSGSNISWNGLAGYVFKTPGVHKAVFIPSTSNSQITEIDCSLDAVFDIENLNKTSATSININANPNIKEDVWLSCPPTTLTLLTRENTVKYHNLKNLPRSVTYLDYSYGYHVIGSLRDLPATVQRLVGGNCGDSSPGSIAHLSGTVNASVSSNNWSSSGVDSVLLSMSDAVWDDLGRFTYAAPILGIGGTNAAPGGSSGAASINPMTTPGSGNSDTDWQWTANTAMLTGSKVAPASGSTYPNTIFYQKHVAMPGIVLGLVLYSNSGVDAKVALYSDSSGAPNALLTSSTSGAAIVPGWNTVPFDSSYTMTAGTTYWLAFKTSATASIPLDLTGGVGRYASSMYADAFPATAPGSTSDTYLFGLYGYGSGHKALTGKAAVGYLSRVPSHAWTIATT